MSNKVCQSQKTRKNDIVFTPVPVALLMLSMCDLQKGDKVLDPCKGGGVFYDNMPKGVKRYWCEIDKGVDFFAETRRFDCIVGNPPYSMWDKWIDHTMELSDKFCYIFGFLNFSEKRLHRIFEEGFGLTKMHVCSIDWWFGRSLIGLFEKNKPSIITVSPNVFLCDVCGGRCGRGRKGKDGVQRSHNECGKRLKEKR